MSFMHELLLLSFYLQTTVQFTYGPIFHPTLVDGFCAQVDHIWPVVCFLGVVFFTLFVGPGVYLVFWSQPVFSWNLLLWFLFGLPWFLTYAKILLVRILPFRRFVWICFGRRLAFRVSLVILCFGVFRIWRWVISILSIFWHFWWNLFRRNVFGWHGIRHFIHISDLFYFSWSSIDDIDSFMFILFQSFDGDIHFFMHGSIIILKWLNFCIPDLIGQFRSMIHYFRFIHIISILPQFLNFSISFILDYSLIFPLFYSSFLLQPPLPSLFQSANHKLFGIEIGEITYYGKQFLVGVDLVLIGYEFVENAFVVLGQFVVERSERIAEKSEIEKFCAELLFVVEEGLEGLFEGLDGVGARSHAIKIKISYRGSKQQH